MKLLLFGITREIVGSNTLQVPDSAQAKTVGMLRNWLLRNFPKIGNLSSLAIAVNSEYASDDTEILEGSEVALIPPVSGG